MNEVDPGRDRATPGHAGHAGHGRSQAGEGASERETEKHFGGRAMGVCLSIEKTHSIGRTHCIPRTHSIQRTLIRTQGQDVARASKRLYKCSLYRMCSLYTHTIKT
jgi:hypothetical protein